MDGLKVIESPENVTWRNLKEILATLSDEELDQKAMIWYEESGGNVSEIYITTEDFINPSGDGVEPVSLYEDEDLLNEPVIINKGTLILVVGL